jgi:hypothetical protein
MALMLDMDVSYAVASSLATHFQTTQVIGDHEEAIAIADKIVAAQSPGDSLTPMQIQAIHLVKKLAMSQLNSYSNTGNLEDAIHRFHALLSFEKSSRGS